MMDEKQLLKRKQRAQLEKDYRKLASICQKLGGFYMENEQYDLALENFQEEFRYLKTPAEKAHNDRMQGEVYTLLKDFKKAHEHISAYQNYARKYNDKVHIQRAATTVGRFYLLQAECCNDFNERTRLYCQAEKEFLKSLQMCKLLTKISKIEVADMEARLYRNLSIIKDVTEKNDECISHLEKAISICRENHLLEQCFECYILIAQFYFGKLSDNLHGMHFANLAISIGKQLDDDSSKICEALELKAKILIKMSDFTSAKQVLYNAYKLNSPDERRKEHIKKTLKVVIAMCQTQETLLKTNESDFKTKQNQYEKLGDGACYLKNYPKAIDCYLEALHNAKLADELNLAPFYVSLYKTYQDDKQWSKALEYMEKELSLNKDEPREAYETLKMMADVNEHLGSGFWEIDRYYQRARDEAIKLNDKRLEQSIVIKQLKLREKHHMMTLVEILKDEAQMAELDIIEPDSQEDSDDVESEARNFTEIGDDIFLDEISDSDHNEEQANATEGETEITRNLRKRSGSTFKLKRNEKGETQLQQACIAGKYSRVKQLIELGHPVNVSDYAGWTPLHEACNYDHVDVVELLIENQASLNDRGEMCDGMTPLHSACMGGSLRAINAMIEAGVDCYVKNDQGDTPIKMLENWRCLAKLDESDLLLYNEIKEKMLKIMQKSGNQTCLTSKSGSTTSDSNDCTPEHIKEKGLTEINTVETISGLRQGFVDNSSDSDSNSESADPIAGVSEYKKVIESLRHKNKEFPISTAENTKKRSAVVEESEIVGEWLDHDMPVIKKRRVPLENQDIHIPRRSKIESSSHRDVHQNSSDEIYIESEDSRDAYDVLMNQPSTSSSSSSIFRRKRRNSSLKFEARNLKSAKTLLDAGFYKSIQETGMSVSETTSEETEVSSTQDSEPLAQGTTAIPISATTNITSIKVKIEDQLLNVPIIKNMIEDLTVGWLADESARRYYNLKRLRPVLRLTTSDGAIYEDTDPVSVTFSVPVVCSTVLEWDSPSISQRYMEECKLNKCAPDENIQNVLSLIQVTQSLTINDQLLTVITSKALFKSVYYQSNLTHLNLRNNFLGDEGIKYLSQALPTLQQIKTINLSGNLISSVGLKYIADIWKSELSTLTKLEALDLSFNPLQNQSVVHLSAIGNHAKNLKTLNLSSTDLTYLSNDQFLNQLIDFDISYNRFKVKDLSKSLKKMNSCKLTRLNIGFCTVDPGISECLSGLFNSGTCEHLTELNLSGLHLNDSDVWELIQPIRRNKSLNRIYLQENPELSSITFELLMERLSIKNLHLEGCPKIVMNINLAKSVEGRMDENVFCKNIWLTVKENGQINFIKTYFNRVYDEQYQFEIDGPTIRVERLDK